MHFESYAWGGWSSIGIITNFLKTFKLTKAQLYTFFYINSQFHFQNPRVFIYEYWKKIVNQRFQHINITINYCKIETMINPKASGVNSVHKKIGKTCRYVQKQRQFDF